MTHSVREAAATEREHEPRSERGDDVRPAVEDENVAGGSGSVCRASGLCLDVVARDDRDAPDLEPLGA